jgi:ABC-type nickel/cobalt efflux system permease component RcnA
MKFAIGIIFIFSSFAVATASDSAYAENPFFAGAEKQAQEAAQPQQAPREVDVPFWYPIVVWQKAINDKLTSLLSGLRESFSLGNILLVFFISLMYSIVHTGGPGHGKLILGTYFLTSDVQRRKLDAAIAGIIVSVTHIGMAFILSLILWLFLNTLSMSSQRDMANVSRRIGGILVIITGIVIVLVSILSNKIKALFGEKFELRMKSLSLYSIAILSGIVPCPLAWFVLVFSISYGIYAYGILSIVGMAIGAAITVGTTGLLVLLGREKAMGIIGAEKSRMFAVGLRCIGGVVLLILGAIMVAPT